MPGTMVDQTIFCIISALQGVNAYTMVDHTCFTVTTVTPTCLLSILPTFIDHILRCPFTFSNVCFLCV